MMTFVQDTGAKLKQLSDGLVEHTAALTSIKASVDKLLTKVGNGETVAPEEATALQAQFDDTLTKLHDAKATTDSIVAELPADTAAPAQPEQPVQENAAPPTATGTNITNP